MKFKPAKTIGSVLGQLCKLIPAHLVTSLAGAHRLGSQARTFSPWCHVVSLLYAQLTHAISLNDVCDALRHHAGALAAIRGAKPPARNTFSHANRTRDSSMMESLFWKMLERLLTQSPGFGQRYQGLPRRFKRAIFAIDSSTIALVANCMSWAKHRRRKAAAKLHLRLNLQTFLPGFAIVEEASHHDQSRARQLCAGLKDGEIALFDKAYIDFAHLWELTGRDIFWVTRAKDNMSYRVQDKQLRRPEGKVLRDDIIVLKGAKSLSQHPGPLRRVEMLVELDGKEMPMAFITNNLEWAASTVAALYKSRWGIEVFFKQIKQTLCICDFLGHTKHAIRWQLWAALLLYVLLRFLAQVSGWAHSFTRLFTIIRGVVWDRVDLARLLGFYGTAGGHWRMGASPQTVYLPGFDPPTYGTACGA